MNKKIFLLPFLFCITFAKGQNTWVQKSNLPGMARMGAVAFSIGSKGYISTGLDNLGTDLNDLWEFDQVNNSWTQKANFPGGGRFFSSSFSTLTKGYLATGDASGGYMVDLWEYDPLANSWTAKANIGGSGRCCAATFVIGDHLYLGTGVDAIGYQSDLWEFVPATNIWTQKATMPGTQRALAVGFSIGDKGYLGTGAGPSGTGTNDVWQYDTTSNSWTQVANLPGPGMSECVGFSIGNFGFIGLGTPQWGSGCTDNFWKFDPAGNSWSAIATFPGGVREEAVAFVIGCKAYVGTGFIDDASVTAKNDLWEYTPDSNTCNVFALFTAPNHVCPGTCINFTNLSGNVSSSYWSFPGANPDTSSAINPQNICYQNPGTYDVQLIVSNSISSDILLLNNYITVYPSPPPQGIIQNGDTLFANPGAGSYQWYFNGDSIQGATDYFHIAMASGNYNVVVTDENGCQVEAGINNVIAEVTHLYGGEEALVVMFPNPVTETLYISINKSFDIQEISVYNLLGEKINMSIDVSRSEVNCRSLSPGLYMIEIFSGTEILRTTFIKQ